MKTIRGFTLVELLVVIAIIALLLAIIVPSLNAVRELASGVVCLNNQKSLSTAWSLYAENNDDWIVGGSTYRTGEHARPSPYRWVEPPMPQPVYGGTRTPLNAASLTHQRRLNGIRAGMLFAYIENEEVYHCPGDRTFLNPEPYAVYRSYAITGLMNGEHFRTREGNNEFGRITQYLQFNGKDLRVAKRRTQIRTPSDKIVFAEEDVVESKRGSARQEYNKGSFVLLSNNSMNWWDAPAGFHKEGGTFGFADGHAERKKWQNRNTLDLIENAIPDPSPQTNEDLLWLVQRYIPIP